MIGQPQVGSVLGDVLVRCQAGQRPQVYRLGNSQPAADFLGRSAPAQRVLLVICVQRLGNLVDQYAPAQRGVDHGIGVDPQRPQHDDVALFGQNLDSLHHLGSRKVGTLCQHRYVAWAPLFRDAENNVLPGPFVQRHQPVHYLRREPAVPPPGIGVDHLPAAKGVFRRTEDEVVALYHGKRVRQEHLHPAVRAGGQSVSVQ